MKKVPPLSTHPTMLILSENTDSEKMLHQTRMQHPPSLMSSVNSLRDSPKGFATRNITEMLRLRYFGRPATVEGGGLEGGKGEPIDPLSLDPHKIMNHQVVYPSLNS
ncbi:hypothetical protein J6590_059783 [Homalodisca vitripennis]|nr:hypothetical protein J6590_059783 [Homalodisca vitripennis]